MSRPQVGVAVPEGPGGRLSAMTPAGGGGAGLEQGEGQGGSGRACLLPSSGLVQAGAPEAGLGFS